MEYREEIKAAIDYIEQHLDQEIRVDNVTAAAGFSKYHFQRIFKSKTGLAVYEYSENEYATVMQQFSADRFLGKRVRFAAFVKAQDVEGWAGLWMRLDGRFSVTLKLDNMQNRPIRGTSEWNLYSCVLDVPPETEVINIGILLSGKGNVWMDNTSFQEVDHSVPVTEFEIRKEYPEYPENMSFEE